MIFESKAQNAIYPVTGSILDYAFTLENGIHYATISTADNVDGSDTPATGKGFIFEIHRYGQVINIYATQFVTEELKRFCKKHYNNTWSEWFEF